MLHYQGEQLPEISAGAGFHLGHYKLHVGRARDMAHLLKAEYVAVVDVVGSVLRVRVLGEPDLHVGQQLCIRAVKQDPVPLRRAGIPAWQHAYPSKRHGCRIPAQFGSILFVSLRPTPLAMASW